MEKAKNEVSYRVLNAGGYVEVTLFVVSEFKGERETIVAQQEGIFDTMEDARPLVDYLESVGSEIEYVTAGTQTK